MPIDVLDCAVGDLLAGELRTFVRERARRDLAFRRVLDRAFAGSRARCVVVPFDVPAEARLLVAVARTAGIPTIVVQHGGYLEAERFPDLQVADTVALWSKTAAAAADGRTHDIVVVGYPGTTPGARAASRAGRRTFLVLGESLYTTTCARDARQMQRHLVAAIDGVLAVEPDARIVLRPHPSSGSFAADGVRMRYPDADVVVDTTSDIFALLRTSDICVGTYSTAAMQAALVDTPVVLLSIAQEQFPWPLDGSSGVPVVHSSDELGAAIRAILRNGSLVPGRDELLTALGAMTGGGAERLVQLIAERSLG
jgi:hypothetical protein